MKVPEFRMVDLRRQVEADPQQGGLDQQTLLEVARHLPAAEGETIPTRNAELRSYILERLDRQDPTQRYVGWRIGVGIPPRLRWREGYESEPAMARGPLPPTGQVPPLQEVRTTPAEEPERRFWQPRNPIQEDRVVVERDGPVNNGTADRIVGLMIAGAMALAAIFLFFTWADRGFPVPWDGGDEQISLVEVNKQRSAFGLPPLAALPGDLEEINKRRSDIGLPPCTALPCTDGTQPAPTAVPTAIVVAPTTPSGGQVAPVAPSGAGSSNGGKGTNGTSNGAATCRLIHESLVTTQMDHFATSGSHIHLEFHYGGRPEQETLLPTEGVPGGRFNLVGQRVEGWVWEYADCSDAEVMAQIEANIKRRLAGGATNTGYIEWNKTGLFAPAGGNPSVPSSSRAIQPAGTNQPALFGGPATATHSNQLQSTGLTKADVQQMIDESINNWGTGFEHRMIGLFEGFKQELLAVKSPAASIQPFKRQPAAHVPPAPAVQAPAPAAPEPACTGVENDHPIERQDDFQLPGGTWGSGTINHPALGERSIFIDRNETHNLGMVGGKIWTFEGADACWRAANDGFAQATKKYPPITTTELRRFLAEAKPVATPVVTATPKAAVTPVAEAEEPEPAPTPALCEGKGQVPVEPKTGKTWSVPRFGHAVVVVWSNHHPTNLPEYKILILNGDDARSFKSGGGTWTVFNCKGGAEAAFNADPHTPITLAQYNAYIETGKLP